MGFVEKHLKLVFFLLSPVLIVFDLTLVSLGVTSPFYVTTILNVTLPFFAVVAIVITAFLLVFFAAFKAKKLLFEKLIAHFDPQNERKLSASSFSKWITVVSVFILVSVALFLILNPIIGTTGDLTQVPEYSMFSSLREAFSRGHGISSYSSTTLERNHEILIREVIGSTPINSSEITISCIGGVCGTTSSNNKIIVLQNTKAYVVACANQERESNPKYVVSIGKTVSEVTKDCKQKAGLD